MVLAVTAPEEDDETLAAVALDDDDVLEMSTQLPSLHARPSPQACVIHTVQPLLCREQVSRAPEGSHCAAPPSHALVHVVGASGVVAPPEKGTSGVVPSM